MSRKQQFLDYVASLAGMALVAAVATFSLYLGNPWARDFLATRTRETFGAILVGLIIYCVWVRVSDVRQARKAPAVVPTGPILKTAEPDQLPLPLQDSPEDFTPAQWRQYLAYRQRRERDERPSLLVRIISYAALSIMALYVAIWLSADFLSFVIWFKDVVL